MEGCEKHCTFCVVPRTRGPRAQPHARGDRGRDRGLVADGCREVTLLGQTVNAYGRDLTPPTDLAELLERVNDVDGLARIRFTTSNPTTSRPAHPRHARRPQGVRVVPPAAAVGLRPHPRAHEPRLHAGALPRADATRCASRARAGLLHRHHRGLPGETEADFAATMEMVERSATTTSSSSATRAGPVRRAADMPDQVDEAVKAERNAAARGSRPRAAARSGLLAGVPGGAGGRHLTQEIPARCPAARGAIGSSTSTDRGRSRSVTSSTFSSTEVLPHSLRGALATPEEAVCSSR
jgi:tRNA-2-methylthio-N6-dimethylallyladenosine synthase